MPTQTYDIRQSPLSKEEQETLVNEADGRVDVVIQMSVNTLIDEDFNEVLNMLSRKAIGNTLLMEIDYQVVGVDDDGLTLDIRVTGYIPPDL